MPADLEGKGDLKHVYMTGGLDVGHRICISADYDYLRELFSTARLSLRTLVVDLILLTIHNVIVFWDHVVVKHESWHE